MIGELKPYPAMKDSGVGWLGACPEHWKMRKLRHVLRRHTERNRPDLPLLSVVRDKGVVLRDMAGADDNRNYIPDDLAGYKVVQAGQFAVNKMKAWQGSYGVSRHDGIVSPAYYVFDLLGVGGDFFHEAIRSRAYVPEFARASDGVRIGQWDLVEARMRELLILVPPFPEQAAIVRFLDHVDRRIRRYIRTKQKLIKLLEEQKQAIIHRAVTRGLDPNVRLKDSGVEWLGEVPEHWEVRTLGQVAASFRTGPFGSVLHQSDYVEGGTPLVNPTHMNTGRIVEDMRCSVPPIVLERLSKYQLAKNDLIFSRRGDLGRCALVREREVGWICGTGSIRVRIDYDGIEPEYLIEALQVRWIGEYLSLSSVGATMDSLNTRILKGIPILLPPLREQRRILQHIALAVQDGHRLLSNTDGEIALLREYRTRLIADVVSGKVDVRQAAACLPQELDALDPLDDADDLSESEDTPPDDLDAASESAEA